MLRIWWLRQKNGFLVEKKNVYFRNLDFQADQRLVTIYSSYFSNGLVAKFART